MAYGNKLVLRDGRILLYTRNDAPTYHARLKIEGHRGYVVKSTKRVNLEDARRFAEDLYDDLRYKVRNNLDVEAHTFASLWKRWLSSNRPSLSAPRLRYIVGSAERYFLPFFGNKSLEQINDVAVSRYWDWRVSYWTSAEGQAKIETARNSRTTRQKPFKQLLGNVAKIPAQKTLDMERSALKQIFSWGQRNGLVNRVPDIKPPRVKQAGTVDRRPAFELDEWRQLYRYMRHWVSEDRYAEGRDAVRGPNAFHIRHRQLLRNYVLFMGATGLRPNEARQLRWRDTSFFVDANGNQQTMVYVAPTTKTGERETVALRSARPVLERLRARERYTSPDDLVFANDDGQPIENLGKTFKSLLAQAGLLKDRFGRVRTIYSLRHTYATFRILYGDVPIEDLAQNMGTSPATIFAHYRHVTTRQKAHVLGGTLRPELSRKGLYL